MLDPPVVPLPTAVGRAVVGFRNPTQCLAGPFVHTHVRTWKLFFNVKNIATWLTLFQPRTNIYRLKTISLSDGTLLRRCLKPQQIPARFFGLFPDTQYFDFLETPEGMLGKGF